MSFSGRTTPDEVSRAQYTHAIGQIFLGVTFSTMSLGLPCRAGNPVAGQIPTLLFGQTGDTSCNGIDFYRRAPVHVSI